LYGILTKEDQVDENTKLDLSSRKKISSSPHHKKWIDFGGQHPWVSSANLVLVSSVLIDSRKKVKTSAGGIVDASIDTVVHTIDANTMGRVRDLKCLVHYSNTYKSLFVTFRGTDTGSSNANVFTDLLFAQSEISPDILSANDSVVLVHTGFQNAYLSMREKLKLQLVELISNNSVEKIFFLGHSLGNI
jgi:hypothetical protein